MAKWKAGDRVRVVSRPVTEDDRKNNTYFEHMAGLVGTVEFLYDGGKMISVKIDPASLSKISADVHKESAVRMRGRLNEAVSEDGRKMLTSDELNFPVNFNMLIAEGDLESAK